MAEMVKVEGGKKGSRQAAKLAKISLALRASEDGDRNVAAPWATAS
jgi:hypothetical protein